MKTILSRSATTALLAAALFASSCSTAPFDPSKPVEVTGNGFQQGGKTLDYADLTAKLRSHPASKPDIQAAETYRILGLAIGLPSAFVFGWQLGAMTGGGQANWPLFGAGAAGWSASVVFSLIANGKLHDAVDAHNASLASSKKNARQDEIRPIFACTQERLFAGFSYRF